jgi:nitrile hydratase accessory protein
LLNSTLSNETTIYDAQATFQAQATFDEPSHFDEPWQAAIFSLVVSLLGSRTIGLNEWTQTVAQELTGCASGNAAYYQAWTRALERLLVSKNLVPAMALTQYRNAWRIAGETTPHGKPLELKRFTY